MLWDPCVSGIGLSVSAGSGPCCPSEVTPGVPYLTSGPCTDFGLEACDLCLSSLGSHWCVQVPGPGCPPSFSALTPLVPALPSGSFHYTCTSPETVRPEAQAPVCKGVEFPGVSVLALVTAPCLSGDHLPSRLSHALVTPRGELSRKCRSISCSYSCVFLSISTLGTSAYL